VPISSIHSKCFPPFPSLRRCSCPEYQYPRPQNRRPSVVRDCTTRVVLMRIGNRYRFHLASIYSTRVSHDVDSFSGWWKPLLYQGPGEGGREDGHPVDTPRSYSNSSSLVYQVAWSRRLSSHPHYRRTWHGRGKIGHSKGIQRKKIFHTKPCMKIPWNGEAALQGSSHFVVTRDLRDISFRHEGL
jgi:hypothetical protein